MNTLTECVVSTLSPTVVRAQTGNSAHGGAVARSQRLLDALRGSIFQARVGKSFLECALCCVVNTPIVAR
jgi:hypothetical protein